MDSDQARYFIGPDLGPKCLQRISADNTSKQRVNDRHGFRKDELTCPLFSIQHKVYGLFDFSYFCFAIDACYSLIKGLNTVNSLTGTW